MIYILTFLSALAFGFFCGLLVATHGYIQKIKSEIDRLNAHVYYMSMEKDVKHALMNMLDALKYSLTEPKN